MPPTYAIRSQCCPNSSASYGMTIRDFVTLSVMYAIPVQGRDKDHARVLRAESEDGEVQGPAICRKHTLTMSLLNFITAIPLNVRGGSGCYVGVRTLVEALRALGVEVSMVTPTLFTPSYT